jgi:Nucleotidyl transferase AbiEii toxin, Type IV TA system
VFEEVISWVTEQSGLDISPDQITFDIYDNPRGRPNCQGKIGYRGPVSPTSGGWPKIKLDLTADERLVLPFVRREVFHPYSDRPEGGIWANCYAYEEAFGEKLRALGERTRPRDLYDVVNLYRHTDSRPSATVLLDVLRQKCAYKAIAVPTFEMLVPHRPALEGMWSDMARDFQLDDERGSGPAARTDPAWHRRSTYTYTHLADEYSASFTLRPGDHTLRRSHREQLGNRPMMNTSEIGGTTPI